MHTARSLRVVLAEDSVLLRTGLVEILRRFGHQVVAEAGDAPSLIDNVKRCADVGQLPDIVVTDVRMPPGFVDEGLRAAVALRQRWPGLAVVVLSQYVEQTYAAELLDSDGGAGVGYLLKDRVGHVEEFIAALGKVADGGTVVDSEVVRQMIASRRAPLQRLSQREQEVLALMAEGQSNAEIAETLVVSDAAVAKHIGGIMTKLDLPPGAQGHRRVLAVLAYLHG